MSDVIERLVRYARVGTPSNPDNEAQVPSSPREFELAELLQGELLALGYADARVDGHAYVTAHIPASAGAEDLPSLGFCSHIDTSPDAPALDVHPQVLTYQGGDLVIGETKDGTPVALTEANTPGLSSLAGHQLLVTDGTSLLGADDKAGVAEIMALVARLAADPAIPHPRLAICFCPDEEIGHGCSLLDLDSWGASWGYTVDGGRGPSVQYECFNAADVTVSVQGVEIHPGTAKDVMVNALHVLEEFDAMLPSWERPEHTSGYEGFYHLHGISGTVSHATARYIVRDHDRANFENRKLLMREAADLLNRKYGPSRVTLETRDQYHNMAEGLGGCMHLVDNALAAFEAVGLSARVEPIRGGTDGAQLTFRGLPCPNLSTGSDNHHSVREYAVVDQVEAMVDVLQELVGIYAKPVA